MFRLALLVLALAFFTGCGGSEPVDLGPPPGWNADGMRWWQDGVDTTVAFRDLETFEAMALSERPDGKRTESPTHRNVQQKFIALYRNAPEFVDSLFTEIAVPLIDARGQDENRDALERDINRELGKVFFFPRPAPSDVAITYPDSLRQAGIGGAVKMQVYLSEDGAPLAIKLVDPVHPTLDAVAMRATAQKTWQPAASRGETMRSYVRSVLNFTTG
ncbi:MAG: energy transducer TonB [Bacteroidota bacterium]